MLSTSNECIDFKMCTTFFVSEGLQIIFIGETGL